MQLTEMGLMRYSEFHNCFGAVCKGQYGYIWQVWLHSCMLGVVAFILNAYKLYEVTAIDRNESCSITYVRVAIAFSGRLCKEWLIAQGGVFSKTIPAPCKLI